MNGFCDFVEQPNARRNKWGACKWKCETCGEWRPQKRVRVCPKQERPIDNPGLGDRLAQAIKFVAKLLHVERLVEETPGCGCWKRREALNKFGRSFWWTKSAK